MIVDNKEELIPDIEFLGFRAVAEWIKSNDLLSLIHGCCWLFNPFLFPFMIVDFVQLLFNEISITVSGVLNQVEMVVR